MPRSKFNLSLIAALCLAPGMALSHPGGLRTARDATTTGRPAIITATAPLRHPAQLSSRATSRLHRQLRANTALSPTAPLPGLQEPRLLAVVIRGMVRIWTGTTTGWAVSSAAAGSGLTSRSSRIRFVTQNTWQVQLAMCFASLRCSA